MVVVGGGGGVVEEVFMCGDVNSLSLRLVCVFSFSFLLPPSFFFFLINKP